MGFSSWALWYTLDTFGERGRIKMLEMNTLMWREGVLRENIGESEEVRHASLGKGQYSASYLRIHL